PRVQQPQRAGSNPALPGATARVQVHLDTAPLPKNPTAGMEPGPPRIRNRRKSMPHPPWTPSREQIAASRMDAFRRQVNQQFGLSLADYAQLHEWSIQERADFWQALVAFFQVQFTTPPSRILEESGHMTEARWFSGATLNYAAHLLQGPDQQPALISISESGERQQLSFAELRAHVAGLQRSLSAAGVTAGDRVAAILPNGWQAVVALLATSSLGAVWSSCSPDFGSRGIVDRFGQIEPKVLIACGGYQYAGKRID